MPLQLIILSFIFAMGACSFKKDSGEDKAKDPAAGDVLQKIQKEQEKQAFEGQLTEQNVLVNFEEMPEPGAYRMIITWPAQVKRLQLTINEDTPVIISSANSVNSHEKLVFSQKPQKIDLMAYDSFGGAPVSSLSLLKTAPTDYESKGTVELKKDTVIEANRFFIAPSSQIITNGFNLSITTNKFIVLKEHDSDNFFTSQISAAHILTRLPFNKVSKELDYRDSAITIQTMKATGTLRVALVGTDGLDGKDGIAHSNRATNGVSGNDGIIKTKVMKCPGISKKSIDGPICENDVDYFCEKNPTNGSDGSNGAIGLPGENGQDGGPTGNLSVIVKDQSEFSLEVFQKAGQPGKRGKGGPGQQGGLKGLAGKNPNGICQNAKDGSEGLTGPEGKHGLDGKPGKLGDILAKIERLKIQQR